MTILEGIVQRVGEIEQTIEGVATVANLTPQNVGVGLPQFINLILPSRYNQQGNDGDLVTRTISLWLLIDDASAGLTLATQALGILMIDRVHQAFLNRRRLELNDSGKVHNSRLLTDTGVGNIEFAGQQYIGAQFELQVIYYVAAET